MKPRITLCGIVAGIMLTTGCSVDDAFKRVGTNVQSAFNSLTGKKVKQEQQYDVSQNNDYQKPINSTIKPKVHDNAYEKVLPENTHHNQGPYKQTHVKKREYDENELEKGYRELMDKWGEYRIKN
jgi:hypothetical protein